MSNYQQLYPYGPQAGPAQPMGPLMPSDMQRMQPVQQQPAQVVQPELPPQLQSLLGYDALLGTRDGPIRQLVDSVSDKSMRSMLGSQAMLEWQKEQDARQQRLLLISGLSLIVSIAVLASVIYLLSQQRSRRPVRQA